MNTNRVTTFFFFLFVVISVTTTMFAVDDSKLPSARQSRERIIDVKHIALDLRFDWKSKQAIGTASITFSPLRSTDKISLDAAMLEIRSVMSSGKKLDFEYAGGADNDNLLIKLGRIFSPSESVTLTIDYNTTWVNEIDPNSLAGSTGKGLRFSSPTSNDPLKPREVWSFGDPESNRYWFPGYDAPDDLRTTEFRATVDKDLTFISNGRLIETKDNADRTRTFRWRMDTPYANQLTSLVVGEFVDVKQNYNGVELHNYGYAQEKEWVAATTERLADMMRFFSEKTGVKYPYPSYSQVFVQDIGTFTSNMNVATITENMVDDRATHADYLYLWDLTEAEALAQQWFGNYVVAKDWKDAWLNKSFAHYMNCLYTDHRNGRAEWLLWVHSFADQPSYFGDWNAGNRRPIVTANYETADTMSTDNYSTIRGALVLNILHKQLGDQKFWLAVKNYLQAGANGHATTDDFRKAVEMASGEKMDWFFDQWIYKLGHPVFEVSKTYDAAKKQLTVTVKQTQKPDPKNAYPQTEFFQGKIAIEIDGKVEQVTLKPQAENEFTFTRSTAPEFVNFDYENTWIRELKYERSPEEAFALFEKTTDAIARSSALTELATIAKDAKTSPADKERITAAIRKLVLSNAYWRVRFQAMSRLASISQPKLDEATIATLLEIIKRDRSWLRASAIGLLGLTTDQKYADIYLNALNDESFRVINSAAIALGKIRNRTPEQARNAFDALVKLKDKPSMKSQTMISALAGLKQMGDPSGYDIAFAALSDIKRPRWRLPGSPPYWDYRDFAADTIKSLGQNTLAYPLVFERLKTAVTENDTEGAFYNVILIINLADPRGQEAFDLLKEKYKNDANKIQAVEQYETQFKQSLK